MWQQLELEIPYRNARTQCRTGRNNLMTTVRKITYLSAPAEVSMADQWYEIASIDHFWIRRRFKVLQLLTGDLISGARAIAEIGCGNGLVQRQIEDAYGKEVAGFDLNEAALKVNVSSMSPVHCYDIFQKDLSLRERFDVIFLFDVLEHISNERGFLEALIYHLAPGGHLVLNVPAGQWAYSNYDQAVGHVRRYSIRVLRDAVKPSGLRIEDWTYWGLPLVPIVLVRKLWLIGRQGKEEITNAGFDSRSKSINRLMALLASCEPTPQRLIGTSLMAILQLGSKGKLVRPSD
jgi:2-polyprenyl-3-methyl-5-hydroxy-6-metoxy-1,4-benzoquinol methylase